MDRIGRIGHHKFLESTGIEIQAPPLPLQPASPVKRDIPARPKRRACNICDSERHRLPDVGIVISNLAIVDDELADRGQLAALYRRCGLEPLSRFIAS